MFIIHIDFVILSFNWISVNWPTSILRPVRWEDLHWILTMHTCTSLGCGGFFFNNTIRNAYWHTEKHMKVLSKHLIHYNYYQRVKKEAIRTLFTRIYEKKNFYKYYKFPWRGLLELYEASILPATDGKYFL